MSNKNLIKPTKAESLILNRRRMRLNQHEAALRLGLTYDEYRSWEEPGSERGPRQNLGVIKPYEVCYLLRRRSGKTQKEIAKAIGMSRLWVLRMEAGQAPVERLREYWDI